MKVKIFPLGPFNTNCMVLSCKESNNAVVIDPAPNSFCTIKEYCKNLSIKYILITHSHWDHIGDAYKWKSIAPIAVHKLDKSNLMTPGSDGLPIVHDFKGVTPDILLTDGQEIHFGSCCLQVIHTPGHSPGGVCFYSAEESLLISGDTLFYGSMGKTSFPQSSSTDMILSLKRLGTLPDNTKVIPGHGWSTTIGAESWINNADKII